MHRMTRSTGAARRRGAAAWAGVGALAGTLLAGCATPVPPAVEAGPPSAPTPAAGGTVLGRSERFVIYVPETGDTLRSIAARFLGSEDRWWVIADFNGMRKPGDQPIVIPLQAPNPVGVTAERYQVVPILCYHRFGPGSGKMVVSAANFSAQLDWLARNDYRVIPLKDLLGFLDGKQALPKRAVVLTFDDGYNSVYKYAFPLLKRYGFPATVFLYTDFVGGADALTWTQMQEMTESGLIDIQAHSKSHANLIQRVTGESDERYRERIETEARMPRDVIQRKLPLQVTQFAYPYGDANDLVLDVLGRNDYRLAVTVNPGGNAFFAQPLMLRRTMIYGDYDLDAFKAKLQVYREIAPR